MTAKHYNKVTHTFIVNGEAVSFYCSTTKTRAGFCHHVYACGKGKDFEHTRISYYNRTWERYDYESAMYSAAEKFKAKDRAAIRLEIDNIGRAEGEKAKRFLHAFEANYKALSDEQKAFLKEHTPHLETADQANFVGAAVAVLAATGM